MPAVQPAAGDPSPGGNDRHHYSPPPGWATWTAQAYDTVHFWHGADRLGPLKGTPVRPPCPHAQNHLDQSELEGMGRWESETRTILEPKRRRIVQVPPIHPVPLMHAMLIVALHALYNIARIHGMN